MYQWVKIPDHSGVDGPVTTAHLAFRRSIQTLSLKSRKCAACVIPWVMEVGETLDTGLGNLQRCMV